MGALVAVDVNMVLNTRDKLNEKLDGFLEHHAQDLRLGPFMDLDLMPNLDTVVDEAPRDAQVAQTRHFANYGARFQSGRRANTGRANQPERKSDSRSNTSTSARAPFRGKGKFKPRFKGKGNYRGGASRGRGGSSAPASKSTTSQNNNK